MPVLLKDLVARAPQTTDVDAIAVLVDTCERVEGGRTDSLWEDVLFHWQQPNFHLGKDAWVIVTTRGRMVGFACVWHEEHTLISTFVCVHPDYHHRGIGTLLLRLVEVRARQQSLLAAPGTRVVLRGLLNKASQNEQRLFEREGYKAGHQLLRIAFTLVEEKDELPIPDVQRQGQAEISIEHHQLREATPFYDRDGLCRVHVYQTYEKELRPALKTHVHTTHSFKALDVLVGMD